MKPEALEPGQARTVEDCFEMATIDCSSANEEAVGWLSCLDEIFSIVRTGQILGEAVQIKGLDLNGNSVVAVCESDENRIKVTLDSLVFPVLTKTQKLWLKAYNKWHSDNA